MNLTRYLYTGPQSAACLRVEGSDDLLDVPLLTNHVVELPELHDYTRVLLALKHLVEAPPAETPTSVPAAMPPATDSPPPGGKKGAKSDAS
ncbi:hypothetical protein [Pseudomonas sp. 18175]|uniref:hypothetical protein n=1 Tax=Pseudomonas sp. 18175 TaxID=3390056 RepID=UPI003D21AB9B